MTEKEYYDEVKSLARRVLEETRERGDEDELYDVLHETIDGHQWVIYTCYHYQVLQHSDNDGYTLAEWGSDGVVTNGVLNTSLLAFGALYGDVSERISTDAFHQEDDE